MTLKKKIQTNDTCSSEQSFRIVLSNFLKFELKWIFLKNPDGLFHSQDDQGGVNDQVAK